MMKKEYNAPRLTIEVIAAEQMLATSLLSPDNDSQDITFNDDDYDGEFNTKEYTFDW